MMRSAFYLFVACCLLSACNTIRYVGIETYNPAEITFPDNITKVLIVNNAVPQPSDQGYEYSLFGVKQDTCRAKADSALYDACHSLGKAIVDVSYFNDVLLFDKSVRTDTDFYEDKKLAPSDVVALCESSDADAVISIDRLLFDMKKEVSRFAEGYVNGVVEVKVAGVVRAYLPGRDVPLATVYVGDSIYWNESADNLEVLKALLPNADDALRGAAQYIGIKSSPNFIPHWTQESRWYFTGTGSHWKEASAYAASEKWQQAAARWKGLFEHTNSEIGKAKIASNLALCEEMEGHLKEAYGWATQSYELFKRKKGEEDRYTLLLKLYVEALTQRIYNDKKLNIQFGDK